MKISTETSKECLPSTELMQIPNQQSSFLHLQAGLLQLHRSWCVPRSWRRQVPSDLRTDPLYALGYLLGARSCLWK